LWQCGGDEWEWLAFVQDVVTRNPVHMDIDKPGHDETVGGLDARHIAGPLPRLLFDRGDVFARDHHGTSVKDALAQDDIAGDDQHLVNRCCDV
jgi:hypothetical protein